MIFNSTLTWEDHFNHLSTKIYLGLRSLRALSYCTPQYTRLKLAQSLLLPHITYCDILFSHLAYPNNNRFNSQFKKINTVFNNITRYVFTLKKFDHISPYNSSILNMTLTQFLKYKSCMFIFKLLKFKSPQYLHNHITEACSSRSGNCIVPLHHSLQYHNSIFTGGITLFNCLPNSTKLRTNSVNEFSRKCIAFITNP